MASAPNNEEEKINIEDYTKNSDFEREEVIPEMKMLLQ